MCTVLEVKSRKARGDGVRGGRSERRAPRRGDRVSAGRATHAARIAEEVHMDPPPQVHAGVGHEREYTTRPRPGSTPRHDVDDGVAGPRGGRSETAEGALGAPRCSAGPGSARPRTRVLLGALGPRAPLASLAPLAPGSAAAWPPSAASAAAYMSAGRTPFSAVTRWPSGRTSSTVWAAAPGSSRRPAVPRGAAARETAAASRGMMPADTQCRRSHTPVPGAISTTSRAPRPSRSRSWTKVPSSAVTRTSDTVAPGAVATGASPSRRPGARGESAYEPGAPRAPRPR